jgi:chemotaxis signal transduction protein
MNNSDPFAHLSSHQMQILRLRANRLAQRGTSQTQDPPLEVMVLRLGAVERYALPLSELIQVIHPNIFALPGVPAEIAGMLSWHGQMITVLDATRLLGLNPAPDDHHTRVLLLHSPHGTVALKVSEILELAGFAPSSLEAPLVGRLGVQAIYAGHTALLEPAQWWDHVGALLD